MKHVLALGMILVSSTLVGRAMAAGDPASAQALFDEGRRLLRENRFAEACPKFEESQRMDPGIGTLFNLAACYERSGRIASAWARYLEVAAQTKAAGQAAREKAARDRAAALEPRLPKLIIQVRSVGDSGLTITRNGVEIGRGQWGSAIPVDPGDHLIRTEAPDKIPSLRTVRVTEGHTFTVEIPALKDAMTESTSAPVAAALAPPSTQLVKAERPRDAGQTQKIVAVALGATGIVALGVGGAFGLSSKAKRDESAEYCNAENRCAPDGLELRQDALQAGTISTVAFGVGAAALFGGVVVFLTAPKTGEPTRTVSAAPLLGKGTSGVSLRATW